MVRTYTHLHGIYGRIMILEMGGHNGPGLCNICWWVDTVHFSAVIVFITIKKRTDRVLKPVRRPATIFREPRYVSSVANINQPVSLPYYVKDFTISLSRVLPLHV